jgi:hypothetical protein
MVRFQTKNPNLGNFWRALEWKMPIYFLVVWNILRSFGVFYGHLENVVVIWYIFPHFGILCQEKSGNPVLNGRSVKKMGPESFAPLGFNVSICNKFRRFSPIFGEKLAFFLKTENRLCIYTPILGERKLVKICVGRCTSVERFSCIRSQLM